MSQSKPTGWRLYSAWVPVCVSLVTMAPPVWAEDDIALASPQAGSEKEVVLTLRLLSRAHRTPVVGAQIALTHRTTAEIFEWESDAAGEAVFWLPKGDYEVAIYHPDFEAFVGGQGWFRAGENLLELRLKETRDMLIVEESGFKGVQRQVFQAQELKAIPGAFGDPIRALQSLPGVARPAGVEGDIILRGAEATNTGFYFDEMPIPYVFHPFVGKSIVDPALVDDVEFYAGGMPSRFGEVLQGVINIRTGEQPVEGVQQHIDINLFDGGYAIEAQQGRWVIRSGGRYSWVGALVGGVTRLVSDGFRPLVIPKYWDFSLHADFQSSASDTWSMNLLSTRDRLSLNLEEADLAVEEVDDESLSFDPNDLIDAGFLRMRLRHRKKAEDWSTDTWIAGGPETRQNLIGGDLSNQVGVQNGRIGGHALIGRHETEWQRSQTDRVLVGGQVQARWLTVEDFTDAYSSAEGVVETDETQMFAAVWTDWKGTRGPWTWVPGLRGGLYHFNDQTAVLPEPRLSVTRTVSDSFSLKGFLGRFGQSPSMEMTAEGVGNPTLGLMRAWQLSLGADWKQGSWQLDSSLYGSVMHGLVQEDLRVRYQTQADGYAYEESYPYYVAATGYAVGWETLLRLKPSGPFFGWLALTLGKSFREDVNDQWYPSDADMPVSITVLGAWDAPRSWRLSSRYRLTSGRPYTELLGVYDVNWDVYRPLTGEINAGRLPAFRQLDVRIDKTWSRKRSDRTLYLDIQNVFWVKNPIFASYNYSYTELVPGLYLPMIALLGMEVSF